MRRALADFCALLGHFALFYYGTVRAGCVVGAEGGLLLMINARM